MSQKVLIACNITGTPVMLLITVAMRAGITLAASRLATTDGSMVVGDTTDP